MLKEALSYIIGLGNTEILNIGSQTFATGDVKLVRDAKPDAIQIRSLTGLVDYVINNYDKQPPVMIHVESPTAVNVYSTFNRDMDRNHLVKASALLPNISFERFMGAEEFNILLQSCFVPNAHRADLLKVVGNIKEEAVQTVGDNGISQSVTARTGIATVENVVVPNPVLLKPFRTFVEIEQPETEFIFRMQSGPKAGIFEADGGAWKLLAMRSIKEYLDAALSNEILAGKVTIIG